MVTFGEWLYTIVTIKKLDDTGIEPGTSHMLSECDNQLHQTPVIMFVKMFRKSETK